MPAAYVIVWDPPPDWPTEEGMGVRLKILEGKWERAGPFALFVEGGVRRATRCEEGQHGRAGQNG